jgi:hypothetical protein
MGTLDELQRSGIGVAPVAMPPDGQYRLAPLGDQLREAVAVRIQNVADYFFQESVVGDWRTWRDFPNLAPPWPVAWYEYQMPPVWRRRRGTKPCARAGDSVGILAVAVEADPSGWYLLLWMFMRPPYGRAWSFILPYMWLSVAQDGRVEVAMRAPDADGNDVFRTWGGAVDIRTWAPLGSGWPADDLAQPEVVRAEQHYLTIAVKPALLAMTFSHCRNVTVESDAPPPSKLARATLRRHGIPKVVYRTLTIEPATRIVDDARRASGVSAPRALHITRGHFADYRQGAGLFGRYHGLVWRPLHVRGSGQHGIVVKDYAVKQPQEVG